MSDTEPEWLTKAVTLHDYFDGRMTLRVAQPQPQYGTVQLNVEYKGQMLSVDVSLVELLDALKSVTAEPSVTKVFPAGSGYSNSLLFQAVGGYEEDATSVHVSFEDIIKIMGEDASIEAVEITIRKADPA